MPGFIVYVNTVYFGSLKEVDKLFWADLDKVVNMVERENNYSGVHLDNCLTFLNRKG